MSRSHLFTSVVALVGFLVACGDSSPKSARRALGSTCEESSECDEGQCLGGRCLNPEDDEDNDGVVNRVEVDNGTNVLSADTDGDGIRDGDELREDLGNEDTDGDGKPDAIESSVDDADGDCIPDQFDADDDQHDGDLSPLIDKLCSKQGVCGTGLGAAALKVSCADSDSGAFCDYEEVPGYEPVETSCDDLDNDCDGRTDEELPATACQATLVALTLNPRTPVLALADTIGMTLVGTYDDGQIRDVGALATWETSDATRVTVDAAGQVTAIATGEATITATVGELSASTLVTVAAARVTGLTIAPDEPEGQVSDVIQLTANATYEDSSSGAVTDLVTWISSVPEVASVAADGKVTLVRAGETTITALYGGERASVKVVVLGSTITFTTLEIEDSGDPLPVGTQRALGAFASDGQGSSQSVAGLATWTSTAPGVATVSAQGVVTAVAVGQTTIKAAYAGLSDEVVIDVSAAAAVGLRVAPLAAELDVGKTLALTAFVVKTDASTTDVTASAQWLSLTPAVATVSASGVVTGVSAGAVRVQATYDGTTAWADLTVVQRTPVTVAVVVTASSNELAVGQAIKLTATALDSDQKLTDVSSQATWVSTQPLLASVSSQGLVTAISAGTTAIRATFGGKTGELGMTILPYTPVVIGLVVTPAGVTIPRLQSRTLAARVIYDNGTFGNATGVTWQTGNASIATVDASGKVTAVAEGATTVTASAQGFQAVAAITVTPASSLYTSIRIVPEAPRILVGQELIFKVWGTNELGQEVDATAQAIFSVQHPNLATITQTGLAKGVAPGQTTVYAVVGALMQEVTLEVRAKTPLPLVYSASARVFVPTRPQPPITRAMVAASNTVRVFTPVRYPGGYPTEILRKSGVVSAASARVFVPVILDNFREGRLNGVLVNEKPVGVIYE
ncbi:MAG: Ig-like domain-containing protein [Deltaproteobacteria bacterium]|nr:Ig-like domain-containing protein [Deltaproteobacteria bacterium]